MQSLGQPGAREALIEKLQREPGSPWDLVIIGGGITGAGVLREAARCGLKTLLIEQCDFAWGTSSRSSKMVHGGLRYLGAGQLALTRESVQERQRLLEELPGLVDPLPFLMGHYKGVFPGPRIFNLLLSVYDFLAGRRNHRWWRKGVADFLVPGLRLEGLEGATQFGDAVTDDARLVLRVLQEAVNDGAQALNYLEVTSLLRIEDETARVKGVQVRDKLSQQSFAIEARCVISATGAWTDNLRGQLGAKPAIRPLRGSHLVLPAWRLPVAFAVSFFHPQDKRPVFVFPWEGCTVIGTTDLDHRQNMRRDANITQEEVDYLLQAANTQFPGASLVETDVVSTYAGVRPVVSQSGASPDKASTKPSKEKREHSVWDDHGLISVAGGKLTTFRLIALDVLETAKPYLPPMAAPSSALLFKAVGVTPKPDCLTSAQWRRLQGRYGLAASQMEAGRLQQIGFTETLWAEVDWVLQHEMVIHLEDLLLRRTRLGLLLGPHLIPLLPQIKIGCQRYLGWTEARWDQEEYAYRQLMRHSYSLPSRVVPVMANPGRLQTTEKEAV